MKKAFSTFVILTLLFSNNQLQSQVKKSEKNNTVNEINKMLKNNPYRDNFQEITFYYSIEITPGNELIVNLEYDGPFVTVYKAKISDLDPALYDNPAMIPSTYLCWACKSEHGNSCVQNDIVYTGGQKEVHTAGEICLMFSNEKKIYKKLCNAFEKLFSECR